MTHRHNKDIINQVTCPMEVTHRHNKDIINQVTCPVKWLTDITET